jgi:phosphoglycolate phosphatase
MQAWKEIYGLDTNLDVIQHHGNTDPLILIRVAEFHGIAKSDVGDSCKFRQSLSNDARLNKFCSNFCGHLQQAAAKLKDMEDVMLKYYMANADKAGVGLECLPGVKQLLQELKVCSVCDTLIDICPAQISVSL